jgi:serine/threonine protein kinase
MLIQHVVIPMCKALHIAHRNRVLHLDIKPENILIDDKGDAVLIDFGVAKRYDEHNRIINREGMTSRSMFASPELQAPGGMVRFGEEPDLFGLAATVYYLATEGEKPHPIMDLSEQDEDIRFSLDMYGFSEKFADAIVAGLQFSASSRPDDAQAFLNMFPGCERMKL